MAVKLDGSQGMQLGTGGGVYGKQANTVKPVMLTYSEQKSNPLYAGGLAKTVSETRRIGYAYAPTANDSVQMYASNPGITPSWVASKNKKTAFKAAQAQLAALNRGNPNLTNAQQGNPKLGKLVQQFMSNPAFKASIASQLGLVF